VYITIAEDKELLYRRWEHRCKTTCLVILVKFRTCSNDNLWWQHLTTYSHHIPYGPSIYDVHTEGEGGDQSGQDGW